MSEEPRTIEALTTDIKVYIAEIEDLVLKKDSADRALSHVKHKLADALWQLVHLGKPKP